MTAIDEIRARAAAATPGPWQWFGNTEFDRVYLAAAHSGRLYIFTPGVRKTQYVFDHIECEAYTLDEARQKYLIDPARFAAKPYAEMNVTELAALAASRGMTVRNVEEPERPPIEDDFYAALEVWDDDNGLPGDYEQGAMVDVMEDLRFFLAGDRDDVEGARHFNQGRYVLVRGVQHHDDLLFRQSPDLSARMCSYRDLARYEVLAGRTIAEHAAAGATINGERRDLYRADIVGIDAPDAEFIARSRSDVDTLLSEVDRLAAELDDAEQRYENLLAAAGGTSP